MGDIFIFKFSKNKNEVIIHRKKKLNLRENYKITI